MKKIMFLLTGLLLLGSVAFGEDVDTKKSAGDNLSEYIPKVSGDINFTAKSQDAYHSPLDNPDWGWGNRAGASNRDTQFLRLKGNIILYTGNAGKSEWFAATVLKFDVNDPDNMNPTGTPKNINYESSYACVDNAFLMWRPIKVSDSAGNLLGRPLGITVGKQSIKESANAYYNYRFQGDSDDDFVAYTLSALLNKTMVNVDFHVSEGTGLGYALTKGSSDIIQIAGGLSDEYSLTHILYGTAEFAGFGFNTAYQIANGNKSETKEVISDASKAYGSAYSYKTGDYKYSTSAFNTSLNYNFKVNDSLSFKPYAGYQLVTGDQAKNVKYQKLSDKFSTKEIEASFTTLGGSMNTKLLNKKVTFAAEYTIVATPDFDGLGGIEDGEIDAAVNSMNPAYAIDNAYFKGIAGKSKSTYVVSGLDHMLHFESSLDLTERVNVSLFMYQQKAKDVEKMKTTDEQKKQIANVFVTKFGYDAPTAAGTAAALASAIDKTNAFGTEWRDSTSYGINIIYKF